jgi:hypothetical protein
MSVNDEHSNSAFGEDVMEEVVEPTKKTNSKKRTSPTPSTHDAPPSNTKKHVPQTTLTDPMLRIDLKYPTKPFLARVLMQAEYVPQFTKLLMAQITSKSTDAATETLGDASKKKKKKSEGGTSGLTDMMITCYNKDMEGETSVSATNTRGFLMCSSMYSTTSLYNLNIPVNFIESIGDNEPTVIVPGDTFAHVLTQKAVEITAALKEKPMLPIVQLVFFETKLELSIGIPIHTTSDAEPTFTVSRTYIRYITPSNGAIKLIEGHRFKYDGFPLNILDRTLNAEEYAVPISFPIQHNNSIKGYTTSMNKASGSDYTKSALEIAIQQKKQQQWELSFTSKVGNITSTLNQVLANDNEANEMITTAMNGAKRAISYIHASHFHAVYSNMPAHVYVMLRRVHPMWCSPDDSPPIIFDISMVENDSGNDDTATKVSFVNKRPWRMYIAISEAIIGGDEDMGDMSSIVDMNEDMPVFGHMARTDVNGDITVDPQSIMSSPLLNKVITKGRELNADDMVAVNDDQDSSDHGMD